MEMYKCKDCDAEFSEISAEYRHYRSDYCEGVAVLRGKMICPRCGSDDLERLTDCGFCGEFSTDTLCPECRAKAKAIINYAIAKQGIKNADSVLDLMYLYDEYCEELRKGSKSDRNS